MALEDHGSVGWTGAVKVSDAATPLDPPGARAERGRRRRRGVAVRGPGHRRGPPLQLRRRRSPGRPRRAASRPVRHRAATHWPCSSAPPTASDALFAVAPRAGRRVRSVEPVALTTPGVTLGGSRRRAGRRGQRLRGLAPRRRRGLHGARRGVRSGRAGAHRRRRPGQRRRPASPSTCPPRRPTAPRAPALSFDFGDGSTRVRRRPSRTPTPRPAPTRSRSPRPTRRATARAPRARSPSRPRRSWPAAATTAAAAATRPRNVIALATGSWDRLDNGRTSGSSSRSTSSRAPRSSSSPARARAAASRRSGTVRKHGRRVNFTKQRQGPGPAARATSSPITASRPGFITRVISYTMVARKNPKKVVRCLAPGSKKLRPC